ncbi:hypothetical protein SAY86_026843 [Trapa natans]|uniref:Ubiquitin thioesterase OTU n=1 Tax=Trapa natans TaxID=22666 RepID=A0AAN7QFH1_TRANT|nr:hypothetical protein SAY86_026843 [Trapa natans]
MPVAEKLLGIPGDGRCLFRSVAHGAYIRAGKQSPSEGLQKELADELRSRVADEFVKRRAETEWSSYQNPLPACLPAIVNSDSSFFLHELISTLESVHRFLEVDFDTYVRQMRLPHIWGGEPELLMCSHVLQLPITVYMKDRNGGTLRVIAEYGGEYGPENPIRVLYHGYGHYDALLSPTSSKLYKKR